MFQNNTEDVAKQKLLLLYLLKVSPKPLAKEKFTEILIDNFNMNFFIIQQYLSELIQGSFISSNGLDDDNQILTLEDAGNESLKYFKSKLHEDTINKVQGIFGLDTQGNTIPIQAEANSYLRDNGEINVNLKLVENQESIFSMYISVPNTEQATLLMEKWRESPEFYFKSIMDLFISNKPTF